LKGGKGTRFYSKHSRFGSVFYKQFQLKTLLIIQVEATEKIEDSAYVIIQHASFEGAFVQIKSGNDMSSLISKSEKDWYLSKPKMQMTLRK
jgi:hypothetical protein